MTAASTKPSGSPRTLTTWTDWLLVLQLKDARLVWPDGSHRLMFDSFAQPETKQRASISGLGDKNCFAPVGPKSRTFEEIRRRWILPFSIVIAGLHWLPLDYAKRFFVSTPGPYKRYFCYEPTKREQFCRGMSAMTTGIFCKTRCGSAMCVYSDKLSESTHVLQRSVFPPLMP